MSFQQLGKLETSIKAIEWNGLLKRFTIDDVEGCVFNTYDLKYVHSEHFKALREDVIELIMSLQEEKSPVSFRSGDSKFVLEKDKDGEFFGLSQNRQFAAIAIQLYGFILIATYAGDTKREDVLEAMRGVSVEIFEKLFETPLTK